MTNIPGGSGTTGSQDSHSEMTIGDLFGPDGALSKVLPDYVFREDQEKMAKWVDYILTNGGTFMAEAGAGIGKSIAYLAPALLFARRHGKRVVISTSTRTLQDQLIEKDLPALMDALQFSPNTVPCRRLKGRDNYLCKLRWDELRPASSSDYPTPRSRAIQEIASWAKSTQTGDRDEIPDVEGDFDTVWSQFSTSAANCIGRACHLYEECHLVRARQAANRALVVVVNHHLLLTAQESQSCEDDGTQDEWTGPMGRILPDFDRLIVDEAHRLEKAATEVFCHAVSLEVAKRVAHEATNYLPNPSTSFSEAARNLPNLLERMFSHFLARRAPDTDRFDPGDLPPDARGLKDQASQHLEVMAKALQVVVSQTKLMPRLRHVRQELAALLAVRADTTHGTFVSLPPEVRDSFDCAIHDLDIAETTLGDFFAQGARILARISDLQERLSICFTPCEKYVYWIRPSAEGVRGGPGETIVASAAPAHVGELLNTHLFSQMTSTVLTAGALTVMPPPPFRGRPAAMEPPTARTLLKYAAERLGFGPSHWAAWPSPFRFERSRLFIPTDWPSPSENQSGWVEQVAACVRALASASHGRALCLFTSWEMLRKIERALANDSFHLLVQSKTGKKQILQRFQDVPNAVLLATQSFWEGVDIPGSALSLLVLDRLPFPVPIDPIVAARKELLDREGGVSGFESYSLPEASLILRQGLGRLIRRESDVGLAAVLDSRLKNKYEETILDFLPEFGRISDQEQAVEFLRSLRPSCLRNGASPASLSG